MTDNQDNPDINVPSPLTYVVPLILGCLLTKGRTSPSCRAVRHEA